VLLVVSLVLPAVLQDSLHRKIERNPWIKG
jgi:hypothetical protein